MGAPITLNFSWTSAGNFPAGSNAWNGQPLALAPANTYMTPDTKPAAEEINYEFGQIATDLTAINTYLKHVPLQSTNIYGITTSGIIVPANTYWMMAVLSGGGGGGEGGCQGLIQAGSPSYWGPFYLQGGGGAGAPLVVGIFQVNPGDTLHAVIGAGGAGGANGGGAGADGSPSYVTCTAGVFAGTSFIWAPGGKGCGAGVSNSQGAGYIFVANPEVPLNILDTIVAIAPGAIGVADPNAQPPYVYSPVVHYPIGNPASPASGGGAYDFTRFEPNFPHRGGSVFASYVSNSVVKRVAKHGGQSLAQWGGTTSWAGGLGGATGADDGANYPGGCGGGGGGAGAFGPGGAGGTGGAGNSAGAGASGTNGVQGGAGGAATTVPATTNSGGGGGGGGDTGTSVNGSLGSLAQGGGGGDCGLIILFGLGGPPSPP